MYAVHEHFEAHTQAKAWLDDRLNGTDRVGLPWGALLAFLRLSANGRVLSRPMPLRDAAAVVHAWLELPVTWTPQPTERHARTLAELLAGESKGDLVSDAHVAAIAVEHGLILCSTDRDFARFEGLRWIDPLRPRA
ncbi:MAG: VapC toxin family PIN domain ribonuclease [Actinomycetota bacterium]|nr:VapC toxin family PIN domain ribonuclease [Actinomycetota bacterium]